MQFTLVVTSTKTRKNRTGGYKRTDSDDIKKCISCRLFWETELWVRFLSSSFLQKYQLSIFQALSTTILLQDGPFLCLRLGLIIHYKIISQSNIFFTTKNFLVVLLQLYRVCVIIIEHRKRQRLATLTALHPLNQNNHSLSLAPRKSISGSKKRNVTLITTPDESLTFPSSSMTSLRPSIRNGDHFDFDGNTDPLPRRKRSSVSTLIPSNSPAQSSTPRPILSHSKSLTIVQQPTTNLSLTSHQICTEV